MKTKKLLTVLLLLLTGMIIHAQETKPEITQSKWEQIDNFVIHNQKKWKTPGISIAVINGEDEVRFLNYGYSSKKESMEVNEHTLFEIGSTSKAFTGLGLLLLEEDGQISLQDSISDYIPWLKLKYQNEETDVTIGDFLYHKSGIPVDTIVNIPVDDQPGAIKRAVETLIGTDLDFLPGSHFSYATINYDVLGLVIETVSQMTYEDYIREKVLLPLGLTETYTNLENAKKTGNMATGYKMSFLSAREYSAPYYRGNVPAGYIVSSSSDISRWLQIQMGLVDVPEKLKKVIKRSHEADNTVKAGFDGSLYGAGWNIVYESNGFISHGGNNPNFSSYFGFGPGNHVGIAVLGNMNSESTTQIGTGVIEILKGREPEKLISDLYKRFDSASVLVLIASSVLFVFTFFFLMSIIIGIIRKKRKYVKSGGGLLINILGSIGFLLCFAYCLYRIPATFLGGVDWPTAQVWGSPFFLPAAIVIYALVFLFTIYLQILFHFKKSDEKAIYPLVLLSTISGSGNALIVFIINAALFGASGTRIHLLPYFFLGIIVYIISQKIVRTKMAIITNQMIYKKRMDIVDNLLKSPFFKYEKIEEGNIQATLNNDTQQIADAPHLIIGSISGFSTVLFCFIYLGIINFYGFLVSIAVIAIAAGCFFVVGQAANKLWERTRDIQNTFFGFIESLANGFKELTLNKNRRTDFREDLNSCCEETRDKGTEAEVMFANVVVLGELLFTIVIGIVGFVFPILFPEIPQETLLTFVFVFLYMNGPINGLLNNVPRALQLQIAWKRINNFLQDVKQNNEDIQKELSTIPSESVELTLKNITFTYKTEEETFTVGPFNHEFKSGEITFVTGGNGSGKTTLAKLITGLYEPEEGTISVNGANVNYSDLNNCYSSVFSDYHLFKKLYGINHLDKNDDITRILKDLQIDNKVTIEDGVFSSVDLSTGQKKRLALLVSYLDDKPIFLFDEWAADQDPEFRKYFYYDILPGLKAMGKCIIAITHDDHYFDTADKVIKLEMGKIDSVKEKVLTK